MRRGEKGVAGFESGADAGQVSGSGFGGDGPCATVNEESGGMGSGRGHGDMVEHSAEERRVEYGGKTKKGTIKNCSYRYPTLAIYTEVNL